MKSKTDLRDRKIFFHRCLDRYNRYLTRDFTPRELFPLLYRDRYRAENPALCSAALLPGDRGFCPGDGGGQQRCIRDQALHTAGTAPEAVECADLSFRAVHHLRRTRGTAQTGAELVHQRGPHLRALPLRAAGGRNRHGRGIQHLPHQSLRQEKGTGGLVRLRPLGEADRAGFLL